MDSKKMIGKRINSALAKANMKQKDLADVLKVTANTISYFCSGTRAPNLEQLVSIAQALGVSTDYLLGLVPEATSDMTAREVIEYTGLSEATVNSLHHMVENAQPVLDINTTGVFTYRDGCKPILDCFNDLFDALMEDRKTAEKAVNHYVRIRQHSGHWGEYKDDSYYIGAKMDVFPGVHSEKENNIIVEHSCVKMARIIENKLKKKYMGYYLELPDDE